jgi:hypothetical protein
MRFTPERRFRGSITGNVLLDAITSMREGGRVVEVRAL